MLRVIALGVVSGASLTHFLRDLPEIDRLVIWCLTCNACTGLIVIFIRRRIQSVSHSPLQIVSFRLVSCLIVLITTMISAMSWTIFLAQMRRADTLSQVHENFVTRVTFRVQSMSQDLNGQQRFEALVLDPVPAGIPRHLMVTWPDSDTSRVPVLAGNIWRAALTIKRPHGASNPAGFDFEGFMFQKNIRALGKVRGRPELLSDHPFASPGILIARCRHFVRNAMRKALVDARYGSVIIALAIGDQDSVSASDWDVFNRTGITHLVSISGSHVTMLAAFGGLSMMWCWNRLRIGGRHACAWIPSKVMAACAALSVALFYCLLAGWGVPARRTFFMLLVIGLAMIARLPLSPATVLSVAAAVVTVLDPWSPMATGFWLSFGAVLILFALGAQAERMSVNKPTTYKKIMFVLKESVRMQWVITLAMTPVLAFLFQQVSLTSPFANAVAIPVVTFVVTPLALSMAVVSVIPGFDVLASVLGWIANLAMQWTMYPVVWLSESSWSMWSVAAMPVWTLALSIVGVAWALMPPGMPVRWAGWCLILPVLVWRPERPEEGAWNMTVMDVGQGSAILIRTHSHQLLVDTGPKMGMSDAGQRVIHPVMRALSFKKLDALIVSHADMDHAGGLAHILSHFHVGALYASFDVFAWLSRNANFLVADKKIKFKSPFILCVAGQTWTWDKVKFTVLHPATNQKIKDKTNANSCVIHVAGIYHSVLLPGDIGTNEEKMIVQNYTDLQADVVIAGHHGSLTSSSALFVRKINAVHAIAQSGYLNRFKHPAPEVIARWNLSQTKFWRTDHHGAILVESYKDHLSVRAYRRMIRRYWHHM